MRERPSVTKQVLGFTLVELLIAIGVMGVLAGFAINSFSSGQLKARDVKRKADIKNIADALQQYHIDHGRYPIVSGSGWQTSAGIAVGYWITDNGGSPTWPLNQNYLSSMPKDPRNSTTNCNPETTGTCFVYRYRSSDPGAGSTCDITTAGQGYILETRMENRRDVDKAVTVGAICANGGQYGPIGTPPVIYVRTEP